MAEHREHRIVAFVNWAKDEPAEGPPITARPGFRFFRDLTQAEFSIAADALRTLAEEANLQADELESELKRRDGQ